MATFQIPDEPESDVIWTTYAEGASTEVLTQRWHRTSGGWCRPGLDASRTWTWSEVLGTGHVVHDRHPDLCGLAPTPWRFADDGEGLLDARGHRVQWSDVDNLPLIARAVNEFAERITGAARPGSLSGGGE